MWSSIPSSSPTGSLVLRTSSERSASSPRPIAASAVAYTRRSPGPSSQPWSRVQHWLHVSSGDEGTMRGSSDHILTSQAGSLPRPDDLIEAWAANDEPALAEKLTASVAEVVRRQKEAGIDVPGDGEFGKPMAQ